MKKTVLVGMILLVGFIQSFAQFLPTSNLTIFSEDGYKFFVILNGERQNDVAQTNLRLEELPQPYYNCKIIFEDKTQKEISKNMLMLTDADGIPQDVTYKIKKDKSGKQILRFFSFVPAQQNMIRPSNCAVYRFGNPRQMIAGPGFIEQTTTIVEHNNGNGRGNGVGVNMNAGGVGVSVNINDPYINNQTTTTTTTTTTRINSNQSGYNQSYQDNSFNQPQGCIDAFPMTTRDFDAARMTVKNEGFDETRLELAKQIASSNCLSTPQITTLCQLFSFEESKLEFAKFAYDHCIDPRNYFKVSNIFNFSSSKSELNNFIQGR